MREFDIRNAAKLQVYYHAKDIQQTEAELERADIDEFRVYGYADGQAFTEQVQKLCEQFS